MGADVGPGVEPREPGGEEPRDRLDQPGRLGAFLAMDVEPDAPGVETVDRPAEIVEVPLHIGQKPLAAGAEHLGANGPPVLLERRQPGKERLVVEHRPASGQQAQKDDPHRPRLRPVAPDQRPCLPEHPPGRDAGVVVVARLEFFRPKACRTPWSVPSHHLTRSMGSIFYIARDRPRVPCEVPRARWGSATGPRRANERGAPGGTP